MKAFLILFLIITLIKKHRGQPSWPTHTLCYQEDLQVYYTSCDPLQDVGLSIDPCNLLQKTVNLRMSILLRQAIEELHLSLHLYQNGRDILEYDYNVCEPSFQRFLFCGRKRGELVSFDGPVKLPLKFIPPGHINARVSLLNQNQFALGCLNITVIKI
ncbi:lymphocyte antigen 86 [Amia ocellicauda]|uniref:lymphocyte antigen 86 n=1 Tax=Amia ocellicauda TaxID=2972642 RepID=UPI003463B440